MRTGRRTGPLGPEGAGDPLPAGEDQSPISGVDAARRSPDDARVAQQHAELAVDGKGRHMMSLRLTAILAVVVLATGLTALTAAADDSPSGSSATCVAQAGHVAQAAGQQGLDEQGTTDAITTAADDVESEAASSQGDDEAGDQQSADDADEQGEQDQCGDAQGDDENEQAQEQDDAGEGGDD